MMTFSNVQTLNCPLQTPLRGDTDIWELGCVHMGYFQGWRERPVVCKRQVEYLQV